jgi:SpoVK/Ycf46/Vps4 family AAA+-type ATPase
MAKAEQIKALIRSHWSEDPERFMTLALQVAAYEAQQGHRELALEIRDIVDQAKRERHGKVVSALQPELEGLVHVEATDARLSMLVLRPELLERVQRVVSEYLQRHKLKNHGLIHRRKILLTGPPGTGKTLTARVLAHELRLPLMTVQVDKLASKYMGETGAKLRKVFELVERRQAVYFFDEFDALGGGRTKDNDVGEMRRVLNALLQFIEQDRSDSLIVAATNSPELLDKALFRRFDDVLAYELPSGEERRALVANTLGTFLPGRMVWAEVLKMSDGLSHAEVDLAVKDAIKEAILGDRHTVNTAMLLAAFEQRKRTPYR